MAVLACAASTVTQPQPQTSNISDVRVERDGEATVVTLVGLDQPVFTAFQQSDPERLVVDLASVRPDPESDEIPIDDGMVTTVAWSPFATGLGDPMTRVELGLSSKARYDVAPTENGLEIRLWPDAEGGAVAQADDPWAIQPMPEEGAAVADAETSGSATSIESIEPVSEAVVAAPATMLLGLEARRAGEGAVVQLRADGSLDAESFTLKGPERLVIDLPGVASKLERNSVEVGAAHASRVRVGVHADRVRVVIDAGKAQNAFEGRRMIPTGTGLVVALGSGQAVEEAVAEALAAEPQLADLLAEPDSEVVADLGSLEVAPVDESPMIEDESADWQASEPAAPAPDVAPQEAPQAAEGPVTIYGVEYSVQEGQDRIAILGERPFDYLVYEPDAETVVISIEKAVMEPEVAGRLAPEPGGPVSLVTSFEQPDVATPEVRVVVKRAAHLAPQVARRGSLLMVDFAREGATAATPPVLAKSGQPAPVPAPAQPAPATASLQPSAAPSPAVPAPTPAPAAAPAPPASLEPPAAIGILEEGGLFDGKEYTGRRISLDFKDVEIADVLRLIAEVSDLNVIAGDEVAGRVTIRLVDVPWDQALDVILLTKNLGFMRVGNVLRVAPADVIKQEEELRLQERRAKEKLEDLVVKLQPVNYAKAKDIEKMVKKLLSPRGSVNVDERTNTLILKDIASVIDEATALVKAIDTQTPQVMIEAKIVEANLDFSREFGAVWSFGAQPLLNGLDAGSGPQDLGTRNFRLNTASGFGNNATFLNGITAGPTALFNLAGFILDEKLNLELQLQAAEINGDGKVISSPRVVTLDNSKAQIEQGVSIPFQTFENGDAQLEFVDAVLKLEVTPHITADKSIIMKVEVSRNAPDDSVFTATGSPAIAKNEVQTETLVKDGQTLVLGGIYVVDKSNRQSRVPYLHRIPLLGAAFRSDEISDSRKELLIFVTPHIVVVPQLAS